MATMAADAVSQRTHIIIKNARTHNLKGVTVALPRNKFVVITGMSGSGKSSLAFDTLYAEGQRRYVESLSAYARQFLGKMDKPDVEAILGIAPAIAIEQKVSTRTGRSTVGTSTEIYDYIKLLYARVGRTFSPLSGNEVRRETTSDVVSFAATLPKGERLMVAAPIHLAKAQSPAQKIQTLLQQGYVRIVYDGEVMRMDECDTAALNPKKPMLVVIDRLSNQPLDEEATARLADSVETAYFEGAGACTLLWDDGRQSRTFTNRFEADGMTFEVPSVHFFSFNNPVGACKTCEGFGSVIGIDPDAVVPNKRLSVYEDAIACWKGDTMGEWKEQLVRKAHLFDLPIHRPYHQLTAAQKELLWTGNEHFAGLHEFFKYLESKSYKIQYRVMLSRYRGKTPCPDCKGSRLRKDANYVKVGGYSITQMLDMPVATLLPAVQSLALSDHERQVAKRLLTEIENRLRYLCEVGLGYLTLSRLSNSLSGGESQRIQLATSLGSSLVGSMYILDEPSIGLHPHDTERLTGVLRSLQRLGNTVIVVEHDEEIMRAADEIIDMGPEAGSNGGQVVFQGNHHDLLTASASLTADYLTGRKAIAVPAKRRKWTNKITVHGVRQNNLKNVTVHFPLGCLVAVAGVSGSGKSTLVTQILYPALKRQLGGYGERLGDFDELTGDLKVVKAVEFVDQNPIGKSSRSNPVTYVKAFDEIRNLYAAQKMAALRGYKAGHFSFNVRGGRCETCEGEGVVRIGMQFMADVELTCESCNGKRYKAETLEVTYRGKSIADVLDMTVSDALAFFQADANNNTARKIAEKLTPLEKVGLGYVKLGQSSSTLSGGEAQRTKLAAFLARGENEPHTLFIFDEPTTGLHFHDVAKLLTSFEELLHKGHSVLVIEHNLDVLKCADYIIEMGPEGGENGGHLVHAGTPESLASEPHSPTAPFMRDKLAQG